MKWLCWVWIAALVFALPIYIYIVVGWKRTEEGERDCVSEWAKDGDDVSSVIAWAHSTKGSRESPGRCSGIPVLISCSIVSSTVIISVTEMKTLPVHVGFRASLQRTSIIFFYRNGTYTFNSKIFCSLNDEGLFRLLLWPCLVPKFFAKSTL